MISEEMKAQGWIEADQSILPMLRKSVAWIANDKTFFGDLVGYEKGMMLIDSGMGIIATLPETVIAYRPETPNA